MRLLWDHECPDCNNVFEEFTDRDSPEPVKCPLCGKLNAKRLIGTPMFDPKMGLDATSFPTMGDRWERLRVQRRRAESRRMSQNDDY